MSKRRMLRMLPPGSLPKSLGGRPRKASARSLAKRALRKVNKLSQGVEVLSHNKDNLQIAATATGGSITLNEIAPGDGVREGNYITGKALQIRLTVYNTNISLPGQVRVIFFLDKNRLYLNADDILEDNTTGETLCLSQYQREQRKNYKFYFDKNVTCAPRGQPGSSRTFRLHIPLKDMKMQYGTIDNIPILNRLKFFVVEHDNATQWSGGMYTSIKTRLLYTDA